MGGNSTLITHGQIIDGLKRSNHTGVASALYNEAIANIDYDKLALELQEFAREGHRGLSGRHYEDRSTNLKNNTYAKAFKTKSQRGNRGIAVGYNSKGTMNKGFNYGRWITKAPFDGFDSSWTGDDFIQETVDNKNEIIARFYQKKLDEGVRRTNSHRRTVSMTRSISALINFVKRIWRSA